MRGLRLAGLAAAIVGVAVSMYLTVAHYTSPDVLACAEGGTIDCSAVTTSAQSTVLGIPVAVLGLLWFVPMTALFLPAAWRSPDRRIHLARVSGTGAGVAFVLWLIYAELFLIGAICLWCSVAHVMALVMFAASVTSGPLPTDD